MISIQPGSPDSPHPVPRGIPDGTIQMEAADVYAPLQPSPRSAIGNDLMKSLKGYKWKSLVGIGMAIGVGIFVLISGIAGNNIHAPNSPMLSAGPMPMTRSRMASMGLVDRQVLAGSTQARMRSVRGMSSRRSMAPNAVKDIFMPALSSTMTEGKIVSWLKNPGDKVEKGESVAIVESDKADMDVEAFDEGILATIVVPEGGMTGVGNAIAYLVDQESEIAEAKAKVGDSAPGAPAAPAAEAAAPAPAPAPAAAAPAPVAPAATVAAPAPQVAAPQPRADGRVIATPMAKTLAKQLGVDLSVVGGSGPNGRITAQDVERAAGKAPPAAAATTVAPQAPIATKSAPQAPAAVVPADDGVELPPRGSVQPFTTLQAAVSKNMIASMEVPEFYVQTAVSTDKLDEMYRALKPKGIAMSPLLAKAVGLALAKNPTLFASCPDGNSIKYNENVNVAVAVAMPDGGLITPVLADADVHSVTELAASWKDLLGRARSKQLKPAEYSSGTFTISNLGMFGVDSFKPILPPGTAAIMSVGSSQPTVVPGPDGGIKIERQMKLGLAADHRIVYGAQAAEFLRDLKEIIEDPYQLLL